MEATELVNMILTKFYNKTEEEIKKILFAEDGTTLQDNAFETISTMDAARVGKFKTDTTKGFQQGYAKGKEETRKADVAAIKEHFEIETDSDQFDDVIETGKEQIAEKTKAKVVLPTEEAVKKEPWFIKWEKDHVLKRDYEQKENELNAFKQQVESEKIYGTVDQEAMTHLQKLNPDIDSFKDTPAVLKTMESGFRGSLRDYDWQPSGQNSFIPLYKSDGVGRNGMPVKKGDRVEDEHGNLLTLEAIVKEKAPNYFRLLKQAPKGSAGNEDGKGKQGDNGKDGKPVTFKTVKDYNEYVKTLSDDPKDDQKTRDEKLTKRIEAGEMYQKMAKEGTIINE